MIDWDRVSELQEEVGKEDFDEIVTLFLEEVDEATAGLSTGAAGADLAEAMHFLKGCALNLGFRDLAELCATGELQAKDGQGHLVDTDKVVEVYNASRAAFLAELSSLAA